MTYFAHSVKDLDPDCWQSLLDHLNQVAGLAASHGHSIGLESAAYVAGLLHDLGKYSPAFQDYLKGYGPSVDHSTAGAAFILGRLQGALTPFKPDPVLAWLIAAAIAGHHAGLPDMAGAEGSCLQRRLDRPLETLSDDWQDEICLPSYDLIPENFKDNMPSREQMAFATSVLGRMIFSCLVDADFKDTEAFYAPWNNQRVERDWPDLPSMLPFLVSRFDSHMADLERKSAHQSLGSAKLNELRQQVLSHVRGKAGMKPGLFTLTVPTGGGKTLTSLAFALDHARFHNHRRIIYAIPFTSVIEQTASIFRYVLGEDVVLEHHSAIEDEEADKQEKESASEAERQKTKLRQAREDWAAPIVVTTNVQLFESLFAARTSRARKLHNIAGSVIILDEAQTLPRGLLLPAMRMLEELAARYGCSIVLCTATQPALDERNLKSGLPLEGRELAPDPKSLSAILKRAKLRPVGPKSNEQLTDALANEPQSLVIVNSRKHALELYQQCQSADLDGLVHLTTRMCAAHRAQILASIRECLKTGQACRVIATSLVEAGVDLDFPSVWRAEAGLDSLVQAAGRCNREGLHPLEKSIVKIFEAPDYPPPREVGSLIGDMRRIQANHGEDLSSLEAIEAYFQEVYWRLDEKGMDSKRVLECFPNMSRIDPTPDFAYRTAAERFRMIESGLEPVIIAFEKTAEKAINELHIEAIPSGRVARRLQRYVVQVPPKARTQLVANDKAAFAAAELRGDQFCILKDNSLYHPDTGLIWENADYLSVEESLW